jgi:F-type H+-transporting ATPase subunit delta
MKAEQAAREYANAIMEFELSRYDTVDKLFSELSELMLLSKDFSSFLKHPQIPVEDKISILEKFFSRRTPSLVKHILKELLSENTIVILPLIRKEMKKRFNEINNIEEAEVISAISFTDTQKAGIIRHLTDFCNCKIDAVFRTDPSLLGGFRLRIGGKVLDSSISSQLQNICQMLLRSAGAY